MNPTFKIFLESYHFLPPLRMLACSTTSCPEGCNSPRNDLCPYPCSNSHLAPFQSNLDPEVKTILRKFNSDHIPPLSKPSHAFHLAQRKYRSPYDGSQGPRGLTFSSPPDSSLTFPSFFYCVLTTWPLCSSCIMPNMFPPQGLCTYYSLCKDKPSLDVHMAHFLISSGLCSNVILSEKSSPVTLCKIAYTTTPGISCPLIQPDFSP